MLVIPYKNNETPDVFPANFNIGGKLYYYFTCAPAEEQLIMENDGTVTQFNETIFKVIRIQAYGFFLWNWYF